MCAVPMLIKECLLAGWFGDTRPLLGSEIAQLVMHAKRNALGQAVITAFSQVAKSKEVRQFFERGREIAGKNLEVFKSKLRDDYMPCFSILLTSDVNDFTDTQYYVKL